MSGEHVLSRGLFGDGMVTAKNLRVPDNKPVSIDAMTAKILCSTHNSALGKLDDEIKKLSDALILWRNADKQVTLTLNGYFIERWMLKSLVGILSSGWLHTKHSISPIAVRAIFGLQRLRSHDALYLLGDVPILMEHERHVSFNFFNEGERSEGGAIFMTIHGIALVFANKLTDPQAALRNLGTLLDYDVSRATLQRHAPYLIVTGADHTAQLRLNFDWSKKLRPSLL